MSSLRLATLLLAPCAWIGVAAGPGAHAERLTLEHFDAIVRLSEPRLSPAGDAVLLQVSRPDLDENLWRNELLLVSVEDGAQRTLTHERPDVRHARWSPDGLNVAFLAAGHGESEQGQQIFLLPMAGGEAVQLTRAPRGVVEFAFSPKGDGIVFVSQDEPPERPEGPERHNLSFEVGNHDYLAKEAPLPRHLWRIPVEGGEATRLTSGPAGTVGFPGAGLTFSPDGRRLAFTSQPLPHSGEMNYATIEVLDLEPGTRRRLTPEGVWASSPAFSPDGDRVAFSTPEGAGPFFSRHGISVVPAAGGLARPATADLDRGLYGASWLSEDILVGGGYDGTRTAIWEQPIGGEPRRLELGSVDPSAGLGPTDLDVGKQGEIVFVGVEPQRPAELYYLSSSRAAPRRLTDLNTELASLELGRVESLRWPVEDGFVADGVLVYPPDYDERRPYPLVLLIHGGPMGASTEGFSFQHQQLAANDWIVFSPNYRGSGNLGNRYQSAVIDDAGDGSGEDVMRGLAVVVDRHLVDTGRIAVSGWSYGGYMTSWLIGHDTRWRAAVAGAAVTDYADTYSLSDLNIFFRHGFGYAPWTERGIDAWRRQSPIYYAHRIRTPTLILSNTGDLRVPITQSYKLYHALQEQGVETRFIAYPVGGHFPADPVHHRDVYRRWEGWIADHFAAEESSPSP